MAHPGFEKVAPVVDFPRAEARIRQFWRDADIFRKSLAKRRGGSRFVFYEGPPTANGMPHNGHVLTRVMKDVFPRYRSMRGYDAPRRAGWDTHGLAVEIEVEKELRISGRDGILAYGVEPFVRRCLESVFRYTEQWKELTEKLAFWLDMGDEYVTYHAVHFAARADDYVRYLVKPNFRALGPKVGGRMPALKAALQKADGAALLRRMRETGRCEIPVDGAEIALSSDEITISLEALPGFAAAAGGVGVVVLRTQLDPSLIAEGLFREVLNRVQTLRKELDLEYTGRIELTLSGAPELLEAVAPRVAELEREALATRVALGDPPAAGAHTRETAIDGLALTIGLRLS
jgi:isoleucyl-tRNA synthetase